ncbi:myocyte-specific enhancer factor 2 isoform X3 [Zootermopsis nevadensis]|uniref:myocyte-specific enhancer factor 2 isoform X3 n=1 Tax=Zootermopsis nevadensis TaxID=136037 RepID=UPI000B8EC0EB|nr:myocyte-specific enhancer factor 2 isoform X3 [Zootermopsis nevadensis]
MGRKKIQISRITDERNRQVTFNKRKFGVMKKAYELSVLCDCEIALIIFSSSNKLYQYASTDMDKVLLKYTEYNEPHESLTNKNIIEVGMNQGNYSLPVTVPVNSSYGDSSMLQTSPQMPHTSVSPRPSSSETDTVYPSGGMLELSNGYPNSSSPLGGSSSPGPGPSPVLSSKNLQHAKQHSPAAGRANLRVVIPAPQGHSLTADEPSRSTSTLNTPVVALQTPSIPGLGGYPGSLSAFGGQDFSMGPDMGLGTLSWSHQLPTSLAHTSGLPHLAVSSSTPPPSTSPLPVKIKSEPISPPRDGGSHSHTLGHTLSHLQGHSHALPRPNSTGHLTPTPGTVTPTNLSSPGDPRHSNSSDYDSGPMQKRARINEGWAT